jgi:hypothetical protein
MTTAGEVVVARQHGFSIDAGKTEHHCGGEVIWAIDLNGGGGALVIRRLLVAEQRLLYIPGRSVYHASGSYRGDGKSDAKVRQRHCPALRFTMNRLNHEC